MTAHSVAFFGTPDDVDEFTVGSPTEKIIFKDGLSETEYVKTKTLELSASGKICSAYGIAASDDTARNSFGLTIDSASFERKERVSTPCMKTHSALYNAGVFALPDYTKVLQLYDQHIWLGVEESIRLTGKWRGTSNSGGFAGNNITAQGIMVSKSGRHVNNSHIIIGPAATAATTPVPGTQNLLFDTAGGILPASDQWPFIVVGATTDRTKQFYVETADFTQTEEWHTFSITLTRFLGYTDPADCVTSLLKGNLHFFSSDVGEWAPDDGWLGYEALNGDPTMWVIEQSLNLTQDDNPTWSEKISIFPTSEDDVILSLT